MKLEITEADLIREELPECEVTMENFAKARELIAWAEARDEKYLDCGCICASQLGMRVRCLTYFDLETEEWVLCLNPYITDVQGDAYDATEKVINFPNQRVRFTIHPACTISYTDESGKEVEKKCSRHLAVMMQFMCKFLDGCKFIAFERDYLTIKGTKKRGPNERCEKCGQKYKRCLCPVNSTENSAEG